MTALKHGRVLYYRDALFELCPGVLTVVNTLPSDRVTAAYHACLSITRTVRILLWIQSNLGHQPCSL